MTQRKIKSTPIVSKEEFLAKIKSNSVKQNNRYKSELIEALNRIDELAGLAVGEGDSKEARLLDKDYNFIYDFINNRI